LEKKLKAYKQEYIRVKTFCKKQDSIIRKYEDALFNLS